MGLGQILGLTNMPLFRRVLGLTNMPLFRRVHKWSKCINQLNEVGSTKVQERSLNLS